MSKFCGLALENLIIIFKQKEIRVPFKCEEYLYLTYGEDWQTPNRDYIWEEDTTNFKTLNYKSK